MTKRPFLAALAVVTAVALPMQTGLAQEQSEAEPEKPSVSDAPDAPEAEALETAKDQIEEKAEDSELPSFEGPSKEALAAQDMIDAALKKVDDKIERDGNIWSFTLGGRQMSVVTDPKAERMRIVIPVADASKLEEGELIRMMQANFDSALDARYAIANGLVWGTYIHPLTSLTETDFLSGLLQSLSVAQTYGTTYSSGAMVFGGGDSQKQIEEDTPKTDPSAVT